MQETEYLSVTQFAELHGKDVGNTRKLLAAGRIPGAKKIGSQWVIPAGTPWPSDARVTSGKYRNWRKPKPPADSAPAKKKKHELTPAEIEARFAEISALPPVELTPEEEASLAEAMAMDDGTYVSLEEFLHQLGDD